MVSVKAMLKLFPLSWKKQKIPVRPEIVLGRAVHMSLVCQKEIVTSILSIHEL